MKNFSLFLFTILFSLSLNAQCPQNNTFLMSVSPPCPGTSTISCINGGQYVTVDVVAGNDYTFSTCGNAAFDTQITVYNGAAVVGYNDDDCGVQSTVNWTATFTGTVNVLIDEYNCSNTGTCTDLDVTCSLPIQTGNGCNTNTTICTQGLAGPFGFSTPGPAVSSCLDWIGLSYAYIVLYITQTGPLEMLINGDATTGFLDVSIFNIPSGADPCTAIQDVNNEISCNYADNPGGCNEIGTYFGCNSSVPSPIVNAGDVLMIVVENWSNASTNFTLDLAPVPAAQTGPPDPTITPVGPFCTTDAPVQLDAANPGGTWTGTGVSSTGIFNPSSVAPGTYTIDYAIGSAPCNAFSQTSITVNDCSNPCLMTYFSTNIGFCQPDNTFAVDGTFTYSNAPATGTLIVEVTTATGSYTQTFNPPFVDGTTYNYNITNAISDGSAATVEVYFTADPTCTQLINFTAPDACECSAEIGTFTADIIGVSNNNYVLCYGDIIDIQTNDDWTAPGEATNPPGPIYSTGVSWLIYSCPPSVGLIPTATEDVANDPCLLGIMSDFDLNDINDQWIINAYPAGTFTNNIVYYVPITMYSIPEGVYSYVNTSIPCYDLGTPYPVQYLPQIISSFTQTCTDVTATISGGLPALDGSQFTTVPGSLTPANASFGNTTASNGGTITINGLTAGQAFSFQIQDANGCPKTISGTFVGTPVLTYPQTAYCQNAANPSPSITGVSGGTYSSTAGLSINASSGVINLAASVPGTYTITYTTPAAPGPSCSATFTLTINPLPVISVPDQTICAGDAVTLSGNGADTYSWTGAVTDGVSFTPITTNTYTVTGTITASGCTNTDAVTVTVNPIPAVNAGADQAICIGASVTLSGSGASTYSWDNSVSNGVAFSPTATTTYTVSGTSAVGCINTDQVIVTVNPLPIVVSDDVSVCAGGTVAVNASGANTYSWSPGTYLNANTGSSVTFTAGATTTYTVTGTDLNGCMSSDPVTVSVLANAPINAGADVSICIGSSTILTASGGVTYTWDSGLGLGNNFSVSPTATTTYTVVGTDAAGCTGTDAITVTVNPLPLVNAGPDQTICDGTAVTLTASGANTYTWDNSVTNGLAFTPTATTTYTVTGTDVNGCINNDQVIVTVNPIPIVDAGPDQTVCAGTAVTLTASGATTYTWTGGVSDGVSFTPTTTTTYTVTGTTLEGCTSTDNVVVTVNPLPVVNAGPDQTVCDGTSVTLTATGASTYSWDNSVSNGIAFTPVVGTLTYSVIGTSTDGCIGNDQVIVTVNPNPSPLIQGPVEYCTGQFATLSTSVAYSSYDWSTGATTPTANVTQADNPITITVTNGFGCQGTSSTYTVTENNVITANFSVTICQGESAVIHGVSQTTAGTYSQTYSTVSGCDSTSNVTLIVNPLPNVNAGIDQTVCTGTATTLTATGATSYSWTGNVTNGIPFTQAIGSITYTVSGTDVNGCVNTDDVIVNVNPLPVVDAGPDQTVCAGTSVTLNANGASSYTWNNSVSNGVSFIPPASNTYTVTGTDANGCINTDQALITVNPNPIVDAGSDLEICSGESVTLSGTGASTYSWDNGVTNGLSFSPTNTATYTVTGTDANGCTNTDQITVTVNPLPNVGAGPDQTVCIGTSVILSGSGASTYSWTSPVLDGVSFTPGVGSVTYTVTGTTLSGCINTDQVVVTVNPLPIVNAGPDQSVCAGTAVVLSGSGANTYSWNNNVSNGVSFTPLATNTYTVTGTSIDGCVNTDDVIVTVNPIPTVNAGNDIIICENETVILTGSGANTYTWDNAVVNGSSFTPPIGTTTYTVTGTTTAGCADTDQVNVTVNPIPVVTFLPDATLGCAPLTVNFTNTTPNSTNCVWTISNGDVLTGCGTVTSTFTQPGCYDVTLSTTSNGCSSTFTAVNIVCVEGVPTAAFTTSSSIVDEFNPIITLNNNSTGASSYVWDFGDETPNSVVDNPTHNYSEAEIGNYLITLIAYSPFGCSDTAYATIQMQEQLIFYVPNTFTPDDDSHNPIFLPVFTSGFDPQDYVLLIFNRWGEIIFESHDTSVGWDGSYGKNREINLVQDGTYTWKIEFKTTQTDERKMVIGHVNVIR